MTDDKIIKFDKLKDKICDHEYDKFEQFLIDKNIEFTSGNISFEEMLVQADEYMKKLKTSGVDMIDFQKKMMDKIGISSDLSNPQKAFEELENKYKEVHGVMDESERSIIKKRAFIDVYDGIEEKKILRYYLKNNKNNLTIIFDDNIITLVTEGKVDFSDDELNRIVMSYKDCINGNLKIISCEATNIYEYN